MATHSSIPAWTILQTEEPTRLQSLGSQRAGRDLSAKQQQQCYRLKRGGPAHSPLEVKVRKLF